MMLRQLAAEYSASAALLEERAKLLADRLKGERHMLYERDIRQTEARIALLHEERRDLLASAGKLAHYYEHTF